MNGARARGPRGAPPVRHAAKSLRKSFPKSFQRSDLPKPKSFPKSHPKSFRRSDLWKDLWKDFWRGFGNGTITFVTGRNKFGYGVLKTGETVASATGFSAIKDYMPSRNVIKRYRNGAFFHAYNRGTDGAKIFVDDFDRRMFLAAFARRLPSPDVGLIAYCLMPNHFHLVLRQRHEDGITRLMRSALTSYVRQFNGRHQRYGGLFQSIFKASRSMTPRAARSAVAYVHLNPIDLRRGMPWEEHEFSSHRTFLTPDAPPWIDGASAEAVFGGRDEYLAFMESAERNRKRLSLEVSALWVPR